MTTTIAIVCCTAALVLFVLSLKDARLSKESAQQAKGSPLLGLAALGYRELAAEKRARAFLLVGSAAVVKILAFIVGAP